MSEQTENAETNSLEDMATGTKIEENATDADATQEMSSEEESCVSTPQESAHLDELNTDKDGDNAKENEAHTTQEVAQNNVEETLNDCVVEEEKQSIVDALKELKLELNQKLSELTNSFDDKLKYDKSKDAIVDKLHAELLEYRQDVVYKALRPLVSGIVKLHADCAKLITTFEAKDPAELTPQKFINLLAGLQEDIELTLEYNGVLTYREAEEGAPFDPKRQTVIRKIDTSDESKKGCVAIALRPGFERGKDIIEKEKVAVYQYVPETSKNSEAS